MTKGTSISREKELLDGLAGKVGETLGTTDWFAISQEEADSFARLTDEWDPMHNEPKWAEQSEWGGTIAHGFHILSKTFSFVKEATGLPVVTNENVHALNYGIDRVRFIRPLPIGRRARCAISLSGVNGGAKPGRWAAQK